MKKRIAALSLTLTLTVGLCLPVRATGASFNDVPADHWALNSIQKVVELGVMSGVGNGQFAPEKTISAAEFVTMLMRRYYGEQPGGDGAWYQPYIDLALQEELLYGTKIEQDYKFHGNIWDHVLLTAPINRYEMSLILFAIMRDQEMGVKILYDTSVVADWDDFKYIGNYAETVGACYQTGVLTGVDEQGTFNGEGMMSRAQAAVVMDRLIELEGTGFAIKEIPPLTDGALAVTQMSQLTNTIGVEEYAGGFHLNPDLVLYGGAGIGFPSEGYSSFTITVTAADTDTRVTAGVLLVGKNMWADDSNENRGVAMVPAGETRTFLFDCSGSQNAGVSIDADFNGASFAEAWVSNLYLLP